MDIKRIMNNREMLQTSPSMNLTSQKIDHLLLRFQKFTQEEIDNLISLMSMKEIGYIVKTSQ